MVEKHRGVVCHVSSLHSVIDTRITQKEAFSLARIGYHVHLVFAKGPWPDTTPDNVSIHKVKFFQSKLLRYLITCPLVILRAARLPAQVYHFHDPELLIFSPLLKLKGAKIIYDAHEDLPLQVYAKDWISNSLKKPVAKAAGLMLALSNGWVSKYITATHSIAEKFPPKKTYVVRNFPKLDKFVNSTPIEQRVNNVVYLGSITEQRGVLDIVDALALTENVLKMDLAGPVSNEFMEKLQKSPGWSKVDYHGYMAPENIPDFLSQSKLGLVPLKPYANYQDSLPVKMFEYMAAGCVPLVSNFENFNEFINHQGECGLLLEPNNPAVWAQAMDELIVDRERLIAYSNTGKRKVNELYSWSTEENQLFDCYNTI